MKILGKDGKVAGTLKEAAERPAVDADVVADSLCPIRAVSAFIPGLDPITSMPTFVGISEHKHQCRRMCMLWRQSPPHDGNEQPPREQDRGWCALAGRPA